MQYNGLQVGDKVKANGQIGTVTELCEWSGGSLVEVALDRGTICTSASELERVAQ